MNNDPHHPPFVLLRLRRVRCFFLGHQWNEHDLGHYGLASCERGCGKVLAYDEGEPITLPVLFSRQRWRASWRFGRLYCARRWLAQRCRWLGARCSDCRKPERILRWKVGDHRRCDDIPF